MGAFLFWAHFMGFEPASTTVTKAVARKWQNEYCHLAYNISKDSICLSYETYVHYKD